MISRRKIAGQGAERKHQHTGKIDIASPPGVGKTAPKDQGDGYRQQIEGDYEFDVLKTQAIRTHDRRQGDIDHAAIHGGKEDSRHHHDENQPAPRISLHGSLLKDERIKKGSVELPQPSLFV